MLQELETKDPALHKAATEPTPDALRNLMMKVSRIVLLLQWT